MCWSVYRVKVNFFTSVVANVLIGILKMHNGPSIMILEPLLSQREHGLDSK